MTKPKIIVMKETIKESLIRDAGTVAAAWALILPGAWFGSQALQWVGAVIFALHVASRARRIIRKSEHTPESARREIDRIEKAAQRAGL